MVTEVPPAAADAAWYGMRTWIACGFKHSNRGGWHWEQTKMTDPERTEWRWLAMAVSTRWVVAVGCATEAAAERHPALRLIGGSARSLRGFRRGRLMIVAALCLGQGLSVARLIPEPWPKSLDTSQGTPVAHSKAA